MVCVTSTRTTTTTTVAVVLLSGVVACVVVELLKSGGKVVVEEVVVLFRSTGGEEDGLVAMSTMRIVLTGVVEVVALYCPSSVTVTESLVLATVVLDQVDTLASTAGVTSDVLTTKVMVCVDETGVGSVVLTEECPVVVASELSVEETVGP